MDYIEFSKRKHSENLSSKQPSASVFDVAVPDTQRHFMLLNHLLPMAKASGAKSILTIGDSLGRDGAFFKKKMPKTHITVSDLDVAHLINLPKIGLVDEIRPIDVEKIEYPENHFDLVVIKESFHHFPRPWLGFYECARVASKGVLILEPHDVQKGTVLTYPEEAIFRDDYELVGNYKYQINVRESQKVTWAMGWKQLIVKGVNDPYPSDGPLDIGAYEKQKLRLDTMGFSRGRADNLLAMGFFAERLSSLRKLISNSYTVYEKPKNMFLEKT